MPTQKPVIDFREPVTLGRRWLAGDARSTNQIAFTDHERSQNQPIRAIVGNAHDCRVNCVWGYPQIGCALRGTFDFVSGEVSVRRSRFDGHREDEEVENGETSIVLADDYEIFRNAIRALIELEDGFYVGGEAREGCEALEMAERLKPNVLVTDVTLPRLSGIELTRRVVASGAATRVLILSDQEGAYQVKEALRSGASGYVSKKDSGEELIRAIDALRKGQSYISPSVSQKIVDGLARGARDGEADSQLERLTGRERQVLQLVAEGFSSKEIAAQLDVSTRTVESHRGHLMDKLGIHKVSGLVRLAIREGLIKP